jgi:hypothetical protein
MRKNLSDATFKLIVEINALRAERIELLKQEIDYSNHEYKSHYKRIRAINKRLYELTGNDIYNKR